MNSLTKGDIKILEWLKEFVPENLNISEDKKEEKIAKLNATIDKYIEIAKVAPPISVTDKDIKEISDTIDKIDGIVNNYAAGRNTLSLEYLEELKRSLSGEMLYLSVLKENFSYQSDLLEEYSKKQFRAERVAVISVDQKISIPQADKLVEKDSAYVAIRSQAMMVKKYANLLKNKYAVYSQAWQSIIQSVSVSSKENYHRTAA